MAEPLTTLNVFFVARIIKKLARWCILRRRLTAGARARITIARSEKTRILSSYQYWDSGNHAGESSYEKASQECLRWCWRCTIHYECPVQEHWNTKMWIKHARNELSKPNYLSRQEIYELRKANYWSRRWKRVEVSLKEEETDGIDGYHKFEKSTASAKRLNS